MTRCRAPECQTYASYAPPDCRRAQFCKAHKAPDHTDVVSRRCDWPGGCAVRASTRLLGAGSGRFCAAHWVGERRTREPLRRRTRKPLQPRWHCAEPGCSTPATYGPPGTTKRRFCRAHKQPGDVHAVKWALCRGPGCGRYANFGSPATRAKLFCGAHREAGHVNLAVRLCQGPDCEKIAAFGPPGSKQRLFCSAHRQAGHVSQVIRRSQTKQAKAPKAELGPVATAERLAPLVAECPVACAPPIDSDDFTAWALSPPPLWWLDDGLSQPGVLGL